MMFLLFFIVSLFIVPDRLSLHIHTALSFDIVGTPRIDPDVNARRCREVTVNSDVKTGTGESGGDENTGDSSCIGLIEGEGNDDC